MTCRMRLAAICAAILVLAAPRPLSAQDAVDLSEFNEVAIPADGMVSGDVLPLLQAVPLSFPADPAEEGRPRLSITMEQSGETIVFDIRDTGWADDSVAGKAYRGLLEREDDGWKLTRLGSAQLCARGDKVMTKGNCP